MKRATDALGCDFEDIDAQTACSQKNALSLNIARLGATELGSERVDTGALPTVLFSAGEGLSWRAGSLTEASRLLAGRHYLGPIRRGRFVFVGEQGGRLVAAQVWSIPTSRRLPSDGSWLELSRWCLTPEAGDYAGSRMHSWVVRWLLAQAPAVTTLVSYSDPSQGHTGALYRACNWRWAPTWMRLRPPPSRGGSWDGVTKQEVKDRWVFELRRDKNRATALAVDDLPAIRGFVPATRWQATWLESVS